MVNVVVDTVPGLETYNRLVNDAGPNDLTIAMFTLDPKGLAECMKTLVVPRLSGSELAGVSTIRLMACSATSLSMCLVAGKTPIKVFAGATQRVGINPGLQIQATKIPALVSKYAATYFPAP